MYNTIDDIENLYACTLCNKSTHKKCTYNNFNISAYNRNKKILFIKETNKQIILHETHIKTHFNTLNKHTSTNAYNWKLNKFVMSRFDNHVEYEKSINATLLKQYIISNCDNCKLKIITAISISGNCYRINDILYENTCNNIVYKKYLNNLTLNQLEINNDNVDVSLNLKQFHNYTNSLGIFR